MMGFVYAAVAVLSLLSVGHSTPETDCDSLIRPISFQPTEELLGKWMPTSQSLDVWNSQPIDDYLETVWVNFTYANGSAVHQHHMQRMNARCGLSKHEFTLQNETLSARDRAEVDITRLPTTCPDCLVLRSVINAIGYPYTVLVQLSKREKVSDAELQEFAKQAKCLKLPSPRALDPVKGFCPE